ncbi:hypothetical protein [Shinella sp.]|uniref:hypothetical protein n=1 Tax=Shinella sp. TaxID=1870904 RepID=UPI00258F3EC6|nr:hypothetical protein [Shinella sp.]MCW5710717.1 hypothetical protein [Shinella sp.]
MNEVDQLRPVELKVVDELFGMGSGYVLDCTNATFDDFFRREVSVDIYDDAYAQGSGSNLGVRMMTCCATVPLQASWSILSV